jgi:DNA-binding CsgD family transcriptional regulator
MHKALSSNAVIWLSYLESEDLLINGVNHILEICYPDHIRLSNDENEESQVEIKEVYYLNQGGKSFSKREKEVLLWMAEGLSSKMIAGKLNISEHTVINHRRSMQEKSNKPNATALVSFAIRNGII